MSPAILQELGALRPRLLGFALRRLGNRERAEDAVQETLLAALEGIERFGGGSSLGTWLTGILKHKVVDALRASQKEQPLDEDEPAQHEHQPETRLAHRRAVESLEAGLKELPACAARVLVMRAVMGMDTVQVCRELAISAQNCWVMSHRARRALRERPEIRDAL
jgi:RNA polymerase sigma-70 factor (ECF subfamily)